MRIVCAGGGPGGLYGCGYRRRPPRSTLWVPESRRTSCDLLVLVHEPAKAVVSLDLVRLGRCAAGEWS
jgi:hypothetical protein